jgi:hypothetical protein
MNTELTRPEPITEILIYNWKELTFTSTKPLEDVMFLELS